VGVPKFPQLELPRLWGPITSCANLWLRWGLKQSYSSCRKLSNNMLHFTCTQGNRGDSWLLVVGSQFDNLISGPFFGLNFFFRWPNGLCKPILDICVPRAFQWSKEPCNPLSFDPCNRSLKIQESIGTPTPKVKAPLGAWGFISHTFLHSWASLLARNLASPCLGHEPKLGLWHYILSHVTWWLRSSQHGITKCSLDVCRPWVAEVQTLTIVCKNMVNIVPNYAN
jgi:hypothetical protein